MITNNHLSGGKEKPVIITRSNENMSKIETFLSEYQKSTYTLEAFSMPDMYDGVPNIVCKIPASVIVNHFEVPYAKGPVSDKKGYQRNFSKTRILKLANRLIHERISLPLSLSLNIIQPNAFNSFDKNQFKYNPSFHHSLRVMDGQHRILGIKEAFRIVKEAEGTDVNLSGAKEHLEALVLNVTLTNTPRIEKEIQIFVEINSNSKGVPVDVVLANNLRRMAHGEIDVFEVAKSNDEDWQISNANMLSNIVKDFDSVWYKRIKIPGGEHETPNVGITSMTKYLRVITDSRECKLLRDDAKAEFIKSVFNAYWDAFRNEYKEVFDNPKDYAIQKAIGADVWMRLWPMIVQWSADNENLTNLRDPKTYQKAIKLIVESCEGEDKNGNSADGIDFWKVGGPIGSYSSEKGKSILVRELESYLVNA